LGEEADINIGPLLQEENAGSGEKISWRDGKCLLRRFSYIGNSQGCEGDRMRQLENVRLAILGCAILLALLIR